MTQYEREELVERYLNGAMTSAEEGEFFLVAAVDEELQRTLKAYRIMDRAMMNDRDVAVVENSQYRSRVMGMLAASHVAGTGSATKSDAPPRDGEVPTGGGFWRGFGASILGASLVASMIIAISSVDDAPTPAASRPAPQQEAPAATAPQQSAPVTGQSIPETTVSPETKQSTPARPAERRETRSESRSAVKQSAPRDAAEAKGETTPAKRDNVIKLPPKENDKVGIHVEIDDPNAPKK